MNFKEWLNESDEVKPPEPEKPLDKPDNPFVAKVKAKPQRTLSTKLPNYKEDKWRLTAMKWKHRWLEGTYEI